MFFRRAPHSGKRLKVIVCGTGRDGTTSLTEIIKGLAKANGQRGFVVEHEGTLAHHIYNLITTHQETGKRIYLNTLRDLITWVPVDGLVGNGYNFAADLFLEVYGPDLKIVHLKRDNRERCIQSLVENCEHFPSCHVNYTTELCNPDHWLYIQRITAVHCGEMTRAEWDALDLKEKFTWYYDRTHRAIEEMKSKFTHVMELATEDLSDSGVIKRLGRFINPSWRRGCQPVHENSREFFGTAAGQDVRAHVRDGMLLKTPEKD